MARFTLDQSASMLPLVQVIADEIVERRKARRRASQIRDDLESVTTPEGLSSALAELDATIFAHDEGIAHATHELELMGLVLLRLNPLTIHFPGKTRTSNVVFCWQEGETKLCHGHAVGEEEEPRRPLKVRVIDSHKS